jgi:hypothetical protein
MQRRLPIMAIARSGFRFALDRAAWATTLTFAWPVFLAFAGVAWWNSTQPIPPLDSPPTAAALSAGALASAIGTLLMAAALCARAQGDGVPLAWRHGIAAAWRTALLWYGVAAAVAIAAAVILVSLFVGYVFARRTWPGFIPRPILPQGEEFQAILMALFFAAIGVVALVSFVLALRWSMIVPSRAYDRPVRWRESWQMTRGHTFQLIMMTLIFTIFPFVVLFGFFHWSTELRFGQVSLVATNVVGLFLNQWNAGMTAETYRFLVSHKEAVT